MGALLALVYLFALGIVCPIFLKYGPFDLDSPAPLTDSLVNSFVPSSIQSLLYAIIGFQLAINLLPPVMLHLVHKSLLFFLPLLVL